MRFRPQSACRELDSRVRQQNTQSSGATNKFRARLCLP
jgi:hypothetical protein